MKSNAELTEEYFACAEELGGDIAGRRSAYEYMKNSTAIVHEKVVASSFIPRLYNDESWDALRSIAETTHRILCKVIEHYRETPEYRDVFTFDERLRELVLLPRGYADPLPFARIDVFLNEDDLSCGFCEFNGDGSAGMNENREITNSIDQTETFKLPRNTPLKPASSSIRGYGSSFASSNIQSILFPVPDLPSAITLNVA